MNPRNVIVRAPNWVGDAVLAVPALKALRERLPDARLTLLVRPWVRGLFQSAGFVDAVWSHPSPGMFEWIGTAQKVRRQNFDFALLLTNSFESALTVFAGRVPVRVGYATDRRGPLLSQAIPVPETTFHQTRYYLHLIDTCLGTGPHPTIDIEASARGRESARQLLETHDIHTGDRLLVLSPGAAFGSAKRWSEDRFAGVADRLAREDGFRAAVIGSASEQALAARIGSLMREPVALLAGATDLETLVGIMAEADLVVTNDSGPMHIAAAVGTPTLGIFGSTDPHATGPVGRRTKIVRHAVDCSPCLLRECPIDHPCMDGLSVDIVFEASRSLTAVSSEGASRHD